MRRNPRSERGTASPSTVGHLLIAMLRQMRPDAGTGPPLPSSAGSSKVGRTASLVLVGEARPAHLFSWRPPLLRRLGLVGGGRCSFRGSFTFRVASLVKSAYQSRDPEIGVCYWPAACFF
ncbi:hypothetical protein MRX96_004439 [Rhipicephalus microplus]